ncbi:MAG: hypothetical protein P1V97_25265 [Planctomycetota bacterium]|nr:hypothetical protein [Planctomycetota bacterium]
MRYKNFEIVYYSGVLGFVSVAPVGLLVKDSSLWSLALSSGLGILFAVFCALTGWQFTKLRKRGTRRSLDAEWNDLSILIGFVGLVIYICWITILYMLIPKVIRLSMAQFLFILKTHRIIVLHSFCTLVTIIFVGLQRERIIENYLGSPDFFAWFFPCLRFGFIGGALTMIFGFVNLLDSYESTPAFFFSPITISWISVFCFVWALRAEGRCWIKCFPKAAEIGRDPRLSHKTIGYISKLNIGEVAVIADLEVIDPRDLEARIKVVAVCDMVSLDEDATSLSLFVSGFLSADGMKQLFLNRNKVHIDIEVEIEIVVWTWNRKAASYEKMLDCNDKILLAKLDSWNGKRSFDIGAVSFKTDGDMSPFACSLIPMCCDQEIYVSRGGEASSLVWKGGDSE